MVKNMPEIALPTEVEPSLPGLNTPLEEGEPVFVLRARDSLAPLFVALWAAVRGGNTSEIIKVYADLICGPAVKFSGENVNYNDSQKVRSAKAVATEMIDWRKANVERRGTI